MNITPKLSLNKHPKDCDPLSLVNATNVKVTNDLTLISNEEDLKRNEIIYNTCFYSNALMCFCTTNVGDYSSIK